MLRSKPTVAIGASVLAIINTERSPLNLDVKVDSPSRQLERGDPKAALQIRDPREDKPRQTHVRMDAYMYEFLLYKASRRRLSN
jgi:hypothetical protein